jgi:hypothetical protein
MARIAHCLRNWRRRGLRSKDSHHRYGLREFRAIFLELHAKGMTAKEMITPQKRSVRGWMAWRPSNTYTTTAGVIPNADK